MSGRRPAGGAAPLTASSTSRPGGGNIAAMQLFHELKQQFPTVPDDVVSECIAQCSDRPTRFRRLQEAAAAVPRALPYPRPTPEGSSSPPKMTTSCTGKPPISPSTTKRFPVARGGGGRTPTSTSSKVFELPQELDHVSRKFEPHCDVRSDTLWKTPAIRPTSLNLPRNISASCENVSTAENNKQTVSGSVNVSVNVNCSVDLSPNGKSNITPPTPSPRRHSAVLQVTPEPVWCQRPPLPSSSSDTSPRSYTSVNLTLRTPTSNPQPPIDICSTPGSGPSLTYTTSSFDRRQGLESRLQITVGPGTGVGTVSAMRTKPMTSHLSEEGIQETRILPAVRTGALTNLNNREDVSSAGVINHNHGVLLSRQLERKEQLRNELESGRERLCAVKKEVEALRLENSPEFRLRLAREIRHLQSQCERLTQEVDRHSESRVPLGETNEDFYRHIYKGQRGSLRPRGGRRPQSSAPEGDNEPRWPCHMCTFRNHPLMDTCEQCEMPRVLLGKVSSTEDPLIFARPPPTPNNQNTPLAVGLNT